MIFCMMLMFFSYISCAGSKVNVVASLRSLQDQTDSKLTSLANFTCPSGSFRDSTLSQGVLNPDYCAPGQTATIDEVDGLITCTDCQFGTYKDVYGTMPCLLCPADTFLAAAGADCSLACLSCPAHSTSLEGSEECDCDAGFEFISGPSDLSIPMPAGREAWQESR